MLTHATQILLDFKFTFIIISPRIRMSPTPIQAFTFPSTQDNLKKISPTLKKEKKYPIYFVQSVL